MIHTQSYIGQALEMCSAVFCNQSRQTAGKQSRSRTEGRRKEREGQGDAQTLPGPMKLLGGLLLFDYLLLICTVCLMTFCLHPGEFIKLADLFIVMTYTSHSYVIYMHSAVSFIPSLLFSSIFMKFKWRGIFFLTTFTKARMHWQA